MDFPLLFPWFSQLKQTTPSDKYIVPSRNYLQQESFGLYNSNKQPYTYNKIVCWRLLL